MHFISQLRLERISCNKLGLTWTSNERLGQIEIYWSPSPDRIRTQGFKLTGIQGEAGSLTFDDPNPGRRSYFRLQPDRGAARITAERRLPLEGLIHFRDCGGYATEDGRFIKWGLLYRSEQLSGLTEADHAYLQDCGLKLICDYRTENDPCFAPYPEIASARYARIPVASTASADPEHRLIHANRNYVSNHSREFSKMFDLLLRDGNLPVVQHCVAGKDRTGFASAILMLALGVPEKTVMEDYLLTNQFKAALSRKLLPGYSGTSGTEAGLLDTRPEYLQAALDEIHSRYGGVASYLEHALGLPPDKRKQLQHLLLTDE